MIFVFDLDGTVVDYSGRYHHIQSEPKDWNKFFGEIPYDPPFMNMVKWIKSISSEYVVLQTGRPQKYRKSTVRWLKDHGLINSYDNLLMRDDKNFESGVDLKLRFLDQIRTDYKTDQILWIEDKIEVVKAINAQGVLALSTAHFKTKVSLEDM